MSHRPRRILVASVLAAALAGVGILAGQAAMAAVPPPSGSSPSPTGPANPSPLPPSAPTHVVAVAHTNGITVSWTAAQRGCCPIVKYEIAYWPQFSPYAYVGEVGGEDLYGTITRGIQPKSQYRLEVDAVDDQGRRSASSDTLIVVTPATDTGSDTTPPSAPSGLRMSTVYSQGALIGWAPSTDNVGVVGYDVYLYDGMQTYKLFGTTTGTSFNVPLTGVNDYFFVRARDAAGNVSIASNVISAEVTFPPPSSPPPSVPPSSPPPSSPPPSSAPPSSAPPSSAPPSSAPPAATCTAHYQQLSFWNTGFSGQVIVTNTGRTTVNGWNVTFAFSGGQKIQSTWNASYQQSGANVTLTGYNWNAVLQPGASVSIGMVGSTSTDSGAAYPYTFNGKVCTSV